jgi:hypothetical protein
VSNFYANPGQLIQNAEIFNEVSNDAAKISPQVNDPLQTMQKEWGEDSYGAAFAKQVWSGVNAAGQILDGSRDFFNGVGNNVVQTADLITKANNVNTEGANHLVK